MILLHYAAYVWLLRRALALGILLLLVVHGHLGLIIGGVDICCAVSRLDGLRIITDLWPVLLSCSFSWSCAKSLLLLLLYKFGIE